MTIQEKLTLLREKMRERGVGAYIAPTGDPHMSEYAADCFAIRRYITGFTGSAGVAVVAQDACALFVDGRYTIQAANQTSGTEFSVTMSQTAFDDAIRWIKERPCNGKTGIDGRLISKKQADEINVTLPDIDLSSRLIEDIWTDRPSMPSGAPVVCMPSAYVGATAQLRIATLRESMTKDGAVHALISSLDDIAWLCNIRGGDVHNTPVVYAYMLIGQHTAELFIDQSKLTAEAAASLSENGVTLRGYGEIDAAIEAVECVAYDPSRTSAYLADKITGGLTVSEYTALPKAQKSQAELDGFREAAVSDGVAMVKFLIWLDNTMKNGESITECTVCDRVNAFRLARPDCVGISFDPIAGFKANGAMMHYSPAPDTCANIIDTGLMVLDSGGQYSGATTDITRTLAFGEITKQMKRDYTLVLRSHIALMGTVFMDGACGITLDTIARSVLWQECIDYKCGTGHGVGCRLGVHEGPQGMNQRNTTKLKPGMILTVEPGIYREGVHGIRIENLGVVTPHITNEDGEFYRLECLTWCPIDTRPIEVSAMSKSEIDWLNTYHAQVYAHLSPKLSETENAWLKTATHPIGGMNHAG